MCLEIVILSFLKTLVPFLVAAKSSLAIIGLCKLSGSLKSSLPPVYSTPHLSKSGAGHMVWIIPEHPLRELIRI